MDWLYQRVECVLRRGCGSGRLGIDDGSDDPTDTNAAVLDRMEYRGIRYTIRTRIERNEWYVAIHPESIELPGKVVFGSRELGLELHQCE